MVVRETGLPHVIWSVDSPASIRSLFVDGPVGRLEALLNHGKSGATHAGLVCHPHPLFGGTMHTKAVFHTMKALNGFGYPVLRFNFRGVGLSAGEHDYGRGEIDDVRAAVDWLEVEYSLPIVFAGFSFGSVVGMRACADDSRVTALIGVGFPAVPVQNADEEPRSYDPGFLRNCTKPKLFISGARDRYGPEAKLRELVATLPEPKQLVLIEGGDHFFAGRLKEMRGAIEAWVKENVQQ